MGREMVRCAALALVNLALIMLPLQAFAAEPYFIELGNDLSKDETQQQWDDLSARHKVLKGLKLYPKAVYQGGTEVAARIQAGPIEGKNRAQKMCSRLFAEHIPCFVIEGIDNAPPTAMANFAESTGNTRGDKVALPWLAEGYRAPAAPPAPEGNGKGDVEVAEAIRVPLSDEFVPPTPAVTVKDIPAAQPVAAAAPAPVAETPAEPLQEGPGWLQISSFLDDDAAGEFWQEVRLAAPDKATHLRVRTIRPLARGQGATSLNVGPFASNAEANEFCVHAVRAMNDTLQCRFQAEQAQEIARDDALPIRRYIHADAYAARRQMLARRVPVGNLAPVSPGVPKKIYWLQVLSAPSEMEALRSWEDIRTANSDLLQGTRSSVAASMTGTNRYVVRVGPIYNHQEAVTLCSNLHDRNVECRLMLYSGI